MTFQQGVLGKENAEERVGGKGKGQETIKGEEKLNEREKEGAGDERKILTLWWAMSISIDVQRY